MGHVAATESHHHGHREEHDAATMRAPTSRTRETIGWAGFFVSGVLYLVSGFRTGDGWVIAGSVIWLAAVVFFIADRT